MKIFKPSPWAVNFEETYCIASLQLVMMARIQLYLLIFTLSMGMTIGVLQIMGLH